MELLPGRWRLLYSTGRHIGLTLRQTPSRVLIGDAHLTFESTTGGGGAGGAATFSAASDVGFKAMHMNQWPHDKSGVSGRLRAVASPVELSQGRRLFVDDAAAQEESAARELLERKWKKMGSGLRIPLSLPAAKFAAGDVEVELTLGPSPPSVDVAKGVLREVRTQIPPAMFDLSRIVCGTYLDSRLLVLRGVDGSALLFARSRLHDP